MITADLCRDGRVEQGIALDRVAALLHDGPDLLWVNVLDPTDDDWALLEREFAFHPLAMEDARKQNQRAKMDEYEGYLFVTMSGWTGIEERDGELIHVTQEVDVFLGPRYLVTIARGDSQALREMRRRWQQRANLMPAEPSFLLYVLLDTVVDSYFPAIDAFDDEIDVIEDNAYDHSSPCEVAPALVLKKRLLLLRQTLAPLRDLLNDLLRSDLPLIHRGARVYLQDVYDHTLRLVEQVDLHRDLLSGALDAIRARTSDHLNQVMKTLTVISTVMMTLGLIAGIYGMNFRHMPELEWRYGYFGALGVMGLIGVALAAYFRRIRWL